MSKAGLKYPEQGSGGAMFTVRDDGSISRSAKIENVNPRALQESLEIVMNMDG